MAGMNDRARTHEEQALEKRMRDQVEHSANPTTDAQRQHHVAKLANRRIGQNAFNIGGHDGNRRGNE